MKTLEYLKILKRQKGGSLVEYGALLIMIFLVLFGTFQSISDATETSLNNLNDTMSG